MDLVAKEQKKSVPKIMYLLDWNWVVPNFKDETRELLEEWFFKRLHFDFFTLK